MAPFTSSSSVLAYAADALTNNRARACRSLLLTGVTQTATGPINLMLDRLSLNTTLLNATGLTANIIPCGTPYITVTVDGLAPRHSASVTLEFTVPRSDDKSDNQGKNSDNGNSDNNDGNGDITYTPRVLTGGAVP